MAAILAAAAVSACQQNKPTEIQAPVEANKNPDKVAGLNRLQHIVVIYLENHSFDNLYGEFSGTNNLANAGGTTTQVDGSGTAFATLPVNAGAPFPTTLANASFNIDQYVVATQKIPDLVHRYYQEQQQIDGGKMDKFALVSDAKGESMGYYHTSGLPLAAEAAKYTLCDNFFHAA